MGANAGQAVFNIAGLVVGSLYGPLAGYAVSAAGALLFPTTAKSPRSQDQGITRSEVGAAIPIVLGTQKVTGNVVWAAPTIVDKDTDRQGPFGPKVTTYKYLRTFSMILCEGEIQGIARAWRNGKLVYDVGSDGVLTTEDPGAPPEFDSSGLIGSISAHFFKGKALSDRMTVYNGTSTQTPCPVQESYLGVGNVPAYRGLAMVTIEEDDCTDMGGRVANWEFEVVRGTPIAFNAAQFSNELLFPWVGKNLVGLSADPRECLNDHEYRYGSGSWHSTPGPAIAEAEADRGFQALVMRGWQRSDLSLYVVPYDSVDPEERISLTLLYSYADGAEQFAEPPTAGPGVAIACRELYTMAEVGGEPIWWTGRDENGSPVGANPGPGLWWLVNFGDPAPHPEAQFLNNCLGSSYNPDSQASKLGDIGIQVRRKTSAPINVCAPRCGQPYPTFPQDERFCVLRYGGTDEFGNPLTDTALTGGLAFNGEWTRYTNTTTWRYLFDYTQVSSYGSGYEFPEIAIPDDDDRFSDEDYWTNLKNSAVILGFMDEADIYGVDFPLSMTGPNFKVLQQYSTSGGSSVTKYPLGPCVPQWSRYYSNAAFWTDAYAVEVAREIDDPGEHMASGLVYNTHYPVAQNWCYARVPPELSLINRQKITVGQAVAELCERAGATAADYDVSELTEEMWGMRIGAIGATAREGIQQLQQYGYFDVIEVDAQLKFPLRGKAAVASLTDDDLGAHQPGEEVPPLLTCTRIEDIELPKEIRVHFDDVNNDFQAGMQAAKRVLTDATTAIDISVAIAMDSDKAAQMANVALIDAWHARETYAGSLSPGYLHLMPADCVTAPVEGKTQRMRLVSKDQPLPFGAQQVQFVRDDQSIYTSYVVGSNDRGTDTNTGDAPISPTSLILIDGPLLDSADVAPGLYLAVGPMRGDWEWSGASLQRSTDGGSTFSEVLATDKQCVTGIAVGALPEGPTAIWDRANTLTVRVNGTLSSSTEEAVLNGANGAFFGADGRWEYLNFVDVSDPVDNGDGTYTYDLSVLLRGRKGTEWSVTLHESGDTFVLSDARVDRISVPAELIGAEVIYRAVTVTTTPSSAPEQDFTSAGVDMECYAPVHVEGSRDTSHNLTIRWDRRTRISGEWRDSVDVPLNEESERYEVDVLDGATVVRTISATSESASYTAAQQTTDFGSWQPSITVNVYQLSAIAGRGYVGTATI